MSSNPQASAPSLPLEALETALEQSHDVKAKVEACADDLAAANDTAKERMAEGATAVPVAEVLQTGLAVELTVQECADDLQQVTRNLSHGVDEVKAVEHALAQSREALAESENALAESEEALAASENALTESEDALAASRSAERAASQRAMHDEKTGLPNRTLFDDRLTQAIAGAERHRRTLAVMFLDLDRFKLVNDTHGHAAGDAVLAVVAQRLMSHARDEDTVCRNGGDEFLYLLINPRTRADVARIAGLVRAAIAEPIGMDVLQFAITPSIGIALYPEHGRSGDLLIAHADAAMYRAKQRRSPCEFFEAVAGPEALAPMLQP